MSSWMRACLAVLLLVQSSSLAYTVYVNTDVVGGAGDGTSLADAYSSSNAAEAAEQGDYVTAMDAPVYLCFATGGTDDTTAVTFIGSTTSETYPITVMGGDFPSDGIWDDSAYVRTTGNASVCFNNKEDFLTVRNLQMGVTTTGGSGAVIVDSFLSDSNAVFTIDGCIIKATAGGTQYCYGLRQGSTSVGSVLVKNTIVQDCVNGSGTPFYAIQNQGGSGSVTLLNCTIYNNRTGVYRQSGGTVTATNCAVVNNNDDFSGTITVDYCLSDDGDGTNSKAPAAGVGD